MKYETFTISVDVKHNFHKQIDFTLFSNCFDLFQLPGKMNVCVQWFSME